jgi:hypothetical protein
MSRSPAVALLALVLAAGCAARRAAPPAEMSGFLDDYTLLREGGPDELHLVYRNPDARWSTYDKVLLEPVTLWRSGRRSLEPVPEDDLLRLVADFEGAVRGRLGEGFAIVDQAGPGVMRIRLGITQARASDPILDVLTAPGSAARPRPDADGRLDPELRLFLAEAAIEGEIRDAVTGELLAQGIDRRRRSGALPLDTWADVDRALAFWADRACSRLEARTGRR